jgi:tRNA A37 threonylcarbamoyladenosine dehydratase
MQNQFSRTALMLGEEKMNRIHSARVAVFGLGGVGGHLAEALVRSGVGAIDVFDDDRVCITNLNRQIIATRGTVGKYKADVMRERLLEINPDCKIGAHRVFYGPETAEDIDLSVYEYIADCVDTVTAKLELITRAQAAGTPIISSMGAANKINPAAFEVADIYKTSICPLARVMRRELRKRGVKSLKVVYSKEEPIAPLENSPASCKYNCVCPPGTERKCTERRQIPASSAFVPPVAGLIMAGEIFMDIVSACR